jgi:hypothetical protein
MYPREHLWRLLGPFSLKLYNAIRHRLTGLPQNVHHIKCRAATHPEQEHFHGANAKISATTLWRAVHDHSVATAGLADECRTFNPFYPCFHAVR